MTSKEINELRLINKRLNQRLVRMEKTRGTSRDLTKTRQYKSLQELAGQQGVKSRSKTGGKRFKERGLEKLDEAKFKELKKQSLQALNYKSPSKATKEQMKRFEKAGIKMTAEEINDFNEIFKGSLWNNLKGYLGSDQVIEIMKKSGWNSETVSDKFDQYNAAKAGKTFDVDEFRDFLAGYVGLDEIK